MGITADEKKLDQLAIVIISPTLVKNNDYIHVIEDFHRSKFRVCAIKHKQLTSEDVATHFKEMTPATHKLEMLDMEFKKGESVIIVLEKPNCVAAAKETIGHVSIKIGSDFIKNKRVEERGFAFHS